MLSKVCSDMNKPNGQYYLPPVKLEIDKFIEKLPIRKVSTKKGNNCRGF